MDTYLYCGMEMVWFENALMIEAGLLYCAACRQPGKGCFMAPLHWILAPKHKISQITISAVRFGRLRVHRGRQTLKLLLQILPNHSGSFMLTHTYFLRVEHLQPLQSLYCARDELCCQGELSLLIPRTVCVTGAKWKMYFCFFRLRSSNNTGFRQAQEALKLSTPKKLFTFPKLTWTSDPAKDEQVGFQWYAYACIV